MNLYQQADEVHVELRSLALETSLKHHSFGLDIKTNQLASVYLHSFGVRLMVINQQKLRETRNMRVNIYHLGDHFAKLNFLNTLINL